MCLRLERVNKRPLRSDRIARDYTLDGIKAHCIHSGYLILIINVESLSPPSLPSFLPGRSSSLVCPLFRRLSRAQTVYKDGGDGIKLTRSTFRGSAALRDAACRSSYRAHYSVELCNETIITDETHTYSLPPLPKI